MSKIRVGKIQEKWGLWAIALSLLALFMLSDCVMAQENSAENWYKSGRELEKMGSWQEAVEAYDQAIMLRPDYQEAWCAKCKAISNLNLELSGQGQNITFEKAIQACDRSLEIDPASSRSWSSKGFVLYQEAIVTADPDKFNESLAAYEKAIEAAGSDSSALAEAWRGKGTVLSQMGQSQQALAAHEEAIELNESDVEAWMGKAISLSKLGRDEDAVQAYDRILEIYPSEEQRIFDYPYIWYAKGRALEKLGRGGEAAHAYNQSLEDVDIIIGWVASGREFYMNLSEAWQYKGLLLEEQGRYEGAVEALDDATQANPRSIRDWNQKATLLASELGRYEDAIQAYDHALQLDPVNVRALTGKADCLRALGRNREAVQAYDRALDIDPDLAAAWSGKGAALMNMGLYDESLQAYDEALSIIEQDPRHPGAAGDAWFGKAEALVGPDNAEEATNAYNQSLLAYEKAVTIDPESAEAWTRKGRVLLSLKKYNESMQAYERAVEILNCSLQENPEDDTSWWQMADSLDNLGRSDEALQAYDRVIALNSSKAIGAWIRKSDIFISFGKYNESVEAFDGALNLLPTWDKQSIMALWWGLWWTTGTDIYHNAWIADGQILRTTSAWHNKSTGAIENIMVVNSDFIAAWQRQTKGKSVSSEEAPLSSHDEALQAESTNWAQYGFPRSEEPAQMKIAEDWIQKGRERFRNQSFEGAADAYDAAIETAGSNKTLLAAAWQGKGEALHLLSFHEREEAFEYLNASLDYYDEILGTNPGNAGAWFNKSLILRWLGRPGEALDAADRAVELDFENTDFRWQRAELLSMLGRYNESDQAFDETIEMIPASSSRELAEVWTFKGLNFIGQNNTEEALKAFEMVIELDSQEPAGWLYKGDVLKALGRQAEADEAYDKAKELGYVGQ